MTTTTRWLPQLALASGLALAPCFATAQEPPSEPGARRAPGLPAVALPDSPIIINTHEIAQVRLAVLARGLSHPWALAFLPDGAMLVTEREGRLRIIRDGVLDPEPIAGVPTDVLSRGLSGLMEVAVHPDFAENRYVYLTYTRQVEGRIGTVALVRGRLEGVRLEGVEDLFVAESWGGSVAAARLAFAEDGSLFMTMGGAFGAEKPDGTHAFGGQAGLAQDPASHAGKLLRLRDDGTVPADNPFVGRDGYKPEIYSLGHRNQQGLALHPDTGQPWATEHAPQGGDELNAIEAGKNYGWPVVSYGRHYDGPRIARRFWQEGMEEPAVFWVPSIAPSGLAFYTGDRFPQWKGDLFVGSLMVGRIRRTGHLERIELNDQGEELARESILGELRQRIRDVRQGPDGLLYLLTDENEGALLRLEPVETAPATATAGSGH
jgi:glucose/arabinose dehydrogenase